MTWERSPFVIYKKMLFIHLDVIFMIKALFCSCTEVFSINFEILQVYYYLKKKKIFLLGHKIMQ